MSISLYNKQRIGISGSVMEQLLTPEVRIQSSVKLAEWNIYCQLNLKVENKENGPLKTTDRSPN